VSKGEEAEGHWVYKGHAKPLKLWHWGEVTVKLLQFERLSATLAVSVTFCLLPLAHGSATADRQQGQRGATMINNDWQALKVGLMDMQEITRIVASDTTRRIDLPMWLRSEPYLKCHCNICRWSSCSFFCQLTVLLHCVKCLKLPEIPARNFPTHILRLRVAFLCYIWRVTNFIWWWWWWWSLSVSDICHCIVDIRWGEAICVGVWWNRLRTAVTVSHMQQQAGWRCSGTGLHVSHILKDSKSNWNLLIIYKWLTSV